VRRGWESGEASAVGLRIVEWVSHTFGSDRLIENFRCPFNELDEVMAMRSVREGYRDWRRQGDSEGSF